METREQVLQLLKQELQFVESGGYRSAPRSPWRPRYIFEESPSCPNFGDRSRSTTCDECWLMEFVPVNLRPEQVPCRFVALTHDGVTVDSLYRHASVEESEEALRHWLESQIRQIEAEVTAIRQQKAMKRLSA